MLKLTECTNDCFCKDCKDPECNHAGKYEADCPRYVCVYNINTKEFMDCENCLWLKQWYKDIEKAKGGAK